MSLESFMTSNIFDDCRESAIVGYKDKKYVWASKPPQGIFSQITTEEIDALIGKDRGSLFTNGLTLGGEKFILLRDNLQDDDNRSMDIRTKNEEGDPDHNICVGRANTALVLVMGKEGVHGGSLNEVVSTWLFDMENAGN